MRQLSLYFVSSIYIHLLEQSPFQNPEKATFDCSGYSRDTCHKLSGCSALIFQPLLYLNLDDNNDLSLRNDSYVSILPISGKVDTRARVEDCNLPYPISSKYKGYSEITKCQTEIRQSLLNLMQDFYIHIYAHPLNCWSRV